MGEAHLKRFSRCVSGQSPWRAGNPFHEDVVRNSDELHAMARRFLKDVNIENCVAWVGSGLSRPVYPSWDDLVDSLCINCGIPAISPAERENTDSRKMPELLMVKAQECKNANLGLYESTLAQTFGEIKQEARLAYQFLMGMPFRAYITTNFDPLLKFAAELGGGRVRSYPELVAGDLFAEHKPVFYLHGCARKNGCATGKNLILATGDFDDDYTKIVQHFLIPIFQKCPLLFIGYKLGETEIQQIISVAAEIQRIISRGSRRNWPARFALLDMPVKPGTEDIDPSEEESWDRLRAEITVAHFIQYGTRVIFYQPTSRTDHVQVEEFLRILRRRFVPKTTMGGESPEVTSDV